jgi:hypothetical protein
MPEKTSMKQSNGWRGDGCAATWQAWMLPVDLPLAESAGGISEVAKVCLGQNSQ